MSKIEALAETVDAIRRLSREDAIKLLETVIEMEVIKAERALLQQSLEALAA